MSGQGFASLSKQRQKEIAAKGGRAARDKGTAHRWTEAESKSAATKGVLKRKQNLASRALLRLCKIGFDPEHLNALKMTLDEMIYYGGSRGTESRWNELRKRIDEVNNASRVQIP